MATERQIEANRLNAQKSTGPTSPEGKHLAMAAHASGETYDPAQDFPAEIGFVLSTLEINAALATTSAPKLRNNRCTRPPSQKNTFFVDSNPRIL